MVERDCTRTHTHTRARISLSLSLSQVLALCHNVLFHLVSEHPLMCNDLRTCTCQVLQVSYSGTLMHSAIIEGMSSMDLKSIKNLTQVRLTLLNSDRLTLLNSS